MNVTGTLKQRKVDLHRDGYDPERAGQDPLYFRDDDTQNYVPMTKETFAKINNGSLKV